MISGVGLSLRPRVDRSTPTTTKALPAHCLSVKGLRVVAVRSKRRGGGRGGARVGVINREIKRDGAGITQRLIVG